jgi:hypothetical protein
MNNVPNKQTNPVLAGCVSLAVLGIMVGSVSALHGRETAVKQSNIVISHKPSPPSIVVSTPSAQKQSTTNVPTAPPPSPVAATKTAPAPASTAPTVTSPSPTPTPAPSPTPAPAPTYVYKDGSYSAVGTFTAPGVTNHLNVSITISKDAIIDATVTFPAGTDPTSKNWDNKFIANYKPFVIGKPLANLSLSKVASASLTPNGFNDALSQIRTTAHS